MEELDKIELAYIHLVRNTSTAQIPFLYPKDVIETFGKLTRHTVIANSGYDKKTGEAELHRGIAKIITYGTLFLSNPDLPKRFELNGAFNEPDRATMYGGEEKGYTDYPSLDQVN